MAKTRLNAAFGSGHLAPHLVHHAGKTRRTILAPSAVSLVFSGVEG